MFRRHQIVLGLMVAGLGMITATAQWVTQTLNLRPGWNAVYLEVQPEPAESDQVFAGLPVESVWAWNRRFSTVQFIQDVNELVPGQPDWLVHLPSGNPGRPARNLFAIQGGRAYLIKLRNDASPVNWTVKGQPVLRPIDWLADTLNLVGFPLGAGVLPNFQSFFGGSPAQSGQPIYRLSGAGLWERITSPATTLLRAGEAYWVHSAGPSDYGGPLEVEAEQREGLIYGRTVTELTLRIRNRSANSTTVTLRSNPSAPPGPDSPALAGPVPLSTLRVDAAAQQFGWVPLSGPLTRTGLAPGEEWLVRLEVNRARMASMTPPSDGSALLYQSVLEISNGTGSRHWVGVSAEGLQGASAAGGLALPGPVPMNHVGAPHPRAGLWIGAVSIDKVNQPGASVNPDEPTPAASPFQFRLIVHVDDHGEARLLQKVLQMFKPGTLKPDPANPEVQIVDEPGRYVLVTDDALIPQFSGATLRDGQLVARRISSPAFGFRVPILMARAGEFGLGTFTGQVAIGYDDPRNPFKHTFHPDHDNLDERFEAKLPEGVESFGINRRIELEFTADDPDRLAVAGWGDNQLGGRYRETVTGLHTRTLYAAGTFRLTQISQIGVLNDGR